MYSHHIVCDCICGELIGMKNQPFKESKVKLQDTQTFTDTNGKSTDILARWHPIVPGQLVIFDDRDMRCIGRVSDTDGTMTVWHAGVKDWIWTGYTTRRARLATANDLADHQIPIEYINGELKTDVESLLSYRESYGFK